jgi:hypothetical protein
VDADNSEDEFVARLDALEQALASGRSQFPFAAHFPIDG